MTWKNDLVHELSDKGGYVLEMQARSPEEIAEITGQEDWPEGKDRGFSAILSTHDDSLHLVVETGIDTRGNPFVITYVIDGDGERRTPSSFEVVDTLMISC